MMGEICVTITRITANASNKAYKGRYVGCTTSQVTRYGEAGARDCVSFHQVPGKLLPPNWVGIGMRIGLFYVVRMTYRAYAKDARFE